MANPANPAARDAPLIAGVLNNLPLFWGLPVPALQSLAAGSWTIGAPRGEALLRTGARLPGVFAVAYGTVKLTLRNGGSEERLLRLVAARQSFGEASALLGKGSPYDAVALEQTKLVVIPQGRLLALLEREPRFAKALVMSFAERHLQLCSHIGSLSLGKGAQRLASYLGELAANDPGERECAVRLPFSKTLLAARFGMKKETLSRLLRQFSAEGIIAVSRREIRIRERARLAALVREAP